MLYPTTTKTVGALVIGAAAMLAATPTIADNSRGGLVEITITNITRGQIISPVLVASHNARLAPLFTLGETAIPELAALAEDAILEPLEDLLGADPAVFDVATGAGAILPGESATVVIRAPGRYRHVTLAGMLVSTNDAFTALRGVRVPTYGETTVRALAYDAGSEVNNENCDFIPGPPCGSKGVRDEDDAEGYVHVHAGIHGVGPELPPELAPAQYDWRNPVAEVKMRRLRHRD